MSKIAHLTIAQKFGTGMVAFCLGLFSLLVASSTLNTTVAWAAPETETTDLVEALPQDDVIPDEEPEPDYPTIGYLSETFELVDGAWVYYTDEGKVIGAPFVKAGWVTYGGHRFYFPNDFEMAQSQWLTIDGQRYYFDSKGWMATGFQVIGSSTYYFSSTGQLQTGWVRLEDSWYYFSSDGSMDTGWIKVDSVWYYLYDNGSMATGWIEDGGSWYYLSSSGAMQTGWVRTGNYWYYLGKSGAMVTGWVKLGSYWYYLFTANDSGPEGAMATGEVQIGDRLYYFDNNGHWLKNLSVKTLVNSANTIGSGWYAALSNGGWVSDSLLKQINDDMLKIYNRGHDVGFALIDLATGRTLAGNAYKSFYAASSIKGPYVCAIAWSQPGKALQYRSTIANTITWSSNEDYQRLRAAFGSGPMSSFMSWVNVSYFSPGATWVNMRPIDLAKLWIGNNDYFTSASSATWVQPYFKHTANSYIDAALGSSKTVYSKAGWIWSGGRYFVWDDGALVQSGDNPYVLAVMSSASASDKSLLINLVRDIDSAHSQLVK